MQRTQYKNLTVILDAFFFKDLKAGIMYFVSEFHYNGRLVKGYNCVFIAMIPKVSCPMKLSDFRPISLVGCKKNIG